MPFSMPRVGDLSALQFRLLLRVCGDVNLLKSELLDPVAVRTLRDAAHAGPQQARAMLIRGDSGELSRMLVHAARLLTERGHPTDGDQAQQLAQTIRGWAARDG